MLSRVNIIYGLDYNDVDIIGVPSEMANIIDDIAQEFFCWLSVPKNGQRFLVKSDNGREVLSIDTREFVWWLNNVKIVGEPKATIILQHTSYNPQYPSADF